jgi:hypothetical protein
MRYCSADCVAAYQRRLEEGTVAKIGCLESGLVNSRILTTRQSEVRKKPRDVAFNDSRFLRTLHPQQRLFEAPRLLSKKR